MHICTIYIYIYAFGKRTHWGCSLIRLFRLSTLLIVFPCQRTCIHTVLSSHSVTNPLLLSVMHGRWAPVPSISLLSSSFALCPHIPSLHLVVRWKIGETLFSLFPITQNRPGLLKWPRLHLPIGTEPRISPWKKKM